MRAYVPPEVSFPFLLIHARVGNQHSLYGQDRVGISAEIVFADLCRIMGLNAVRSCSLRPLAILSERGVHFWLRSKNALKKIKAAKKWPDALLRSTEISQTSPTAVGGRHEKFRSFHSAEHPGGHFFKAGIELCRSSEANSEKDESGD
jgi:hypothetical protein